MHFQFLLNLELVLFFISYKLLIHNKFIRLYRAGCANDFMTPGAKNLGPTFVWYQQQTKVSPMQCIDRSVTNILGPILNCLSCHECALQVFPDPTIHSWASLDHCWMSCYQKLQFLCIYKKASKFFFNSFFQKCALCAFFIILD